MRRILVVCLVCMPVIVQIRLSVEVPSAVCEDCHKRVMTEFMKVAKVFFD